MKISDISQADLDVVEDDMGLGYLGQNTNPAIAQARAKREAARARMSTDLLMRIQQGLLALGYPIGQANGVYRNRTKIAIGLVQFKMYGNKFPTGIVTGVMDEKQAQALMPAFVEKNRAKIAATADDKKRLEGMTDGVIGAAAEPTAAVAPTAAKKPNDEAARFAAYLATADIVEVTELYIAAQKGEGHTSWSGSMSAEKVKLYKTDIEAEYNKRKGAIQKAEAAITAGGGEQAGQSEQQAGKSYADKFQALLKNPVYWVGVAAVVGVGLYLFMRSRRSVQPVSAVETLSLEGMDEEKPKRKRRRRRKNKKTEE